MIPQLTVAIDVPLTPLVEKTLALLADPTPACRDAFRELARRYHATHTESLGVTIE